MVDANGRPQASTDKVYLGNSQPDWIGGVTNTFTYRNLSMRFLIDGRIGGQIFSQTNAALMSTGVSVETLEHREDGITVDAVVKQNDDSYTQNTTEISAQDYWSSIAGIASEHVFDQTNIRLREFVLSYKIPNSVLNDSFIREINLGVVGRNLFFIYKDINHVDPEASLGTGNNGQGILSYNLPTARSVGFNVNLKF